MHGVSGRARPCFRPLHKRQADRLAGTGRIIGLPGQDFRAGPVFSQIYTSSTEISSAVFYNLTTQVQNRRTYSVNRYTAKRSSTFCVHG